MGKVVDENVEGRNEAMIKKYLNDVIFLKNAPKKAVTKILKFFEK